MNKAISMIALLLFVGASIGLTEPEKTNENLSTTINYLLAFVEKSDCTFFRNGNAYTANEAVKHMKRKYAHFKNDIATPEDFIRLTSSKSLISGRPYMVKTKAGQMVKSETWLLEALEAHRQKNIRKPITRSLQ
jgi:hypothetical protein